MFLEIYKCLCFFQCLYTSEGNYLEGIQVYFFLKIRQTSNALVVAVVVVAEPTVEAGAGGVGDLDDTRGWGVSV